MSTKTTRLLRREKMEITLPILIDLFLTTRKTEGRSPRTIDWYRDMLTRFAKYVGNGSDAKLKDVTIDDARSFVAVSTREDNPLW